MESPQINNTIIKCYCSQETMNDVSEMFFLNQKENGDKRHEKKHRKKMDDVSDSFRNDKV